MNSSKYFGSEEQLVGCSDVTSIYYPCDFSSENIYSDGNEYYAKKDGIRFTQTISRTNIDNAEFATDGSKMVWSSTFAGGILVEMKIITKICLTLNGILQLLNQKNCFFPKLYIRSYKTFK